MPEELIRFIAQELVQKPDAIEINQRDAGRTSIYTLHVDSDDVGRMIGKQGRVANAVRTLLRASRTRQGRRVILEVE